MAALPSAPPLAQIFRMAALTPVLRTMAAVIPTAALSTLSEALLQRDLQFAIVARLELIAYAVGYGVVGVALAWIGLVWSPVAAAVVKTIPKSALLAIAAPHSKRVTWDGAAFRELAGFGSGYAASWMSAFFALEGDNLRTTRTLGTVALGVYGRAYDHAGAGESSGRDHDQCHFRGAVKGAQ